MDLPKLPFRGGALGTVTGLCGTGDVPVEAVRDGLGPSSRSGRTLRRGNLSSSFECGSLVTGHGRTVQQYVEYSRVVV